MGSIYEWRNEKATAHRGLDLMRDYEPIATKGALGNAIRKIVAETFAPRAYEVLGVVEQGLTLVTATMSMRLWASPRPDDWRATQATALVHVVIEWRPEGLRATQWYVEHESTDW